MIGGAKDHARTRTGVGYCSSETCTLRTDPTMLGSHPDMPPRDGVAGVGLYSNEAGRAATLGVGVVERCRLPALAALRIREEHRVVIALHHADIEDELLPLEHEFDRMSLRCDDHPAVRALPGLRLGEPDRCGHCDHQSEQTVFEHPGSPMLHVRG